MRRLLFTLSLLTLIGLAAVWVGRHPGSAIFVWQGYEVQAPIALVLLGLFTVLLAAIQFAFALRWLINWPERYRQTRQARLQKDTTDAVAVGLMALSDGRADEARQAALKARRALPDAGLSLMLAAQAARWRGRAARSCLLRQFDRPSRAIGLHQAGSWGRVAARRAGPKDHWPYRGMWFHPRRRWSGKRCLAAQYPPLDQGAGLCRSRSRMA